jgi:hypothetical protein
MQIRAGDNADNRNARRRRAKDELKGLIRRIFAPAESTGE